MTDKSVDDIFYKIGLTLNSIRDRLKIAIFYNPVIKFSIFWLCLLNELYNSFKGENDPSSIIIVPFAELMGVSQQMLFYITCAALLVLSTQFNFRYNPFNDLNETTLGVLQMVAGALPPIKIGLTNEEQVRRLVKIIDLGSKVNGFLNTFVFIILFWEILFIILANFSLKELNLAMVIINAILFTIWTNYVIRIKDYIFFTILINIHYFKPKSIE